MHAKANIRKFYYYTFGSAQTQEELAAALGKLLDINFVPHDSYYHGPYLLYEGPLADHLSIEDNHTKWLGDWKAEDFKQCPRLICVSVTEGRNVDKLAKSNYLKEQLFKIAGVILIKERILESNRRVWISRT